MTQESLKPKSLLNKLAAKTFSKKEKAFLLILFFALSGGGLYYLQHWTDTIRQKVNIIEPTVPKSITNPSPNISEKIRQTIKETTEVFKKPEMRDPFLPSLDSNALKAPAQKSAPAIKLYLKGILWDKLVPSAIINSKVVKIGDLIFGKTVVDIEKNQVILMENGEIEILELKKK